MKTIHINEVGAPVIVDPVKNTAKVLKDDYLSRYDIETFFQVEEDCEIRYTKNKNTVVKNVSKGDLVFIFRRSTSFAENYVFVVKNSDMKEACTNRIKEIKLKYYKNTLDAECDDSCTKCCDCDAAC